jgi:hypothetical protein
MSFWQIGSNPQYSAPDACEPMFADPFWYEIAPPEIGNLDIINEALTLLGADEIADIDENTPEARAAKRLYLQTYTAALTRRPWTFARATSSEMAATDEGFRIPSEAMGTRGFLVAVVDRHGEVLAYRVEGADVVLDMAEEKAFARYVVFPLDIDLPPAFRKALAAQLAAEIAFAVTESEERVKRWEDAAADLWAEAARIDSQQQTASGVMNRLGAVNHRRT